MSAAMSHRLISTSALPLLATLARPLALVWAAPVSCEKTALIKLPNTTITSATAVAEGQLPLPGRFFNLPNHRKLRIRTWPNQTRSEQHDPDELASNSVWA